MAKRKSEQNQESEGIKPSEQIQESDGIKPSESTEKMTSTNFLADETIMTVLASEGARTIINEVSTPKLYTNGQVNGVIDNLAKYKKVRRESIL